MKKLVYLCTFAVASLLLANCSTDNANSETQAKDLTLIEARFGEYLGKFDNEEDYLPATFGEEWLAKKDSLVKMDSVDVAYYIAGDTVLNHDIGVGDTTKKLVLDKSQAYYYISEISVSPAFKTVIVSNLAKDATLTYLLNYDLKGKYLSGMVVQSLFLKGEQKYTRESVVSDSRAVLVREVSEKGAANKLLNINETGTLIE